MLEISFWAIEISVFFSVQEPKIGKMLHRKRLSQIFVQACKIYFWIQNFIIFMVCVQYLNLNLNVGFITVLHMFMKRFQGKIRTAKAFHLIFSDAEVYQVLL